MFITRTVFIARLTSSRDAAPVATMTGLPFAAMYSISSSQSMSPDPILNAGTYGSNASTALKSYGDEKNVIPALSHSSLRSLVQSVGTEASSYTSETLLVHDAWWLFTPLR